MSTTNNDPLAHIFKPFNDQCPSHIETSQLICRANQLTGFYVGGKLIVKGLSNSTASRQCLSGLPRLFSFLLTFSLNVLSVNDFVVCTAQGFLKLLSYFVLNERFSCYPSKAF